MELRRLLPDLGKRTLVMGILNVTPDSFSDGGKYFGAREAVEHGLRMAQEGADVIDIGGESTRPGSERVGEEEELRRVLPVVKELSRRIDVPISIDTCKAVVAQECIAVGASIVNDVSALRFDAQMAGEVAQAGVPVVLMHMLGEPKTMQANPVYSDVVSEVKEFLRERCEFAVGSGIARENLLIDPGIGFGKALGHNLELLRRLREFKELQLPILVGTSRKSFIGKLTGLSEGERLDGTVASAVLAAANGADVVRVHDVAQCRRALSVADAIVGRK